MTLITRRAAMRGLAILPAAMAASTPAGAMDDTAPPETTLAAWRASDDAEARARHHLLHAAMAIDELAAGETSRWLLTMGGAASSPWADRWFRVRRYDLVPMNDPRIVGGFQETGTDVLEWAR